MANVSDQPEASSTMSSTLVPPLATMRLTPDQLAAAERTREYHVRKLESQMSAPMGLDSAPMDLDSAPMDLDGEPASLREH